MNSYSLTYELDPDSNIFVVKKLIKPDADVITKIYQLQYARVNASPINSASTVNLVGSSLIDTLTSMLSSYGKLSEDSRTNSLIITDVPTQFEVIEQAIRELDVPIPQVVIEVEVIDTTKNLVDQLGFNWSQAAGLVTYTLPMHSFQSSGISGGSSPLAMTLGGPPATTLTLSQIMNNSSTKVLARPKILTLSNEQAMIKIVGEDVIGIVRTEDEDANSVSVSAERTEIGVELLVTPSVNVQNGEITMVLEPKVSSAEDSGFTDQDGNVFKNPKERSAKVTLVAKDNETIILGGLLRQDLSETKSKVPFLGDIPFLGTLFRYKNKTEDRDREMLVFITPRIINKEETVKFNQFASKYDAQILSQREQSDYQYRRDEIDRTLTIWDK